MIGKILGKSSLMRIFLIAIAAICAMPILSNAASCTLTLTGEAALQNEICTTWTGLIPIAIIAVLLSFTIASS